MCFPGPIHNVHAKGYSAGGSSTGCAVLVAAGECDLAVGGDQGGSIRLVRAASIDAGQISDYPLSLPRTTVSLV